MTDHITVQSLDHLVLSVDDIDATLVFYTQVLGMKAEKFHPADGSTRHALKFGAQKINLHDAARPFAPHAARPAPGTADLCFLSEVALDDWQTHFAKHDISIEQGPVARTGATGAILSLYVRDPDGNLIEISNRISGGQDPESKVRYIEAGLNSDRFRKGIEGVMRAAPAWVGAFMALD